MTATETDDWEHKSNRDWPATHFYDITWPAWYTTSFVQVTKKNKPLLNLQALILKSILVEKLNPKTEIEYLTPTIKIEYPKPIACTIPRMGELKAPYNIIHIYCEPVYKPMW